MTVNDIVNAVWGYYDTVNAVKERSKYKIFKTGDDK